MPNSKILIIVGVAVTLVCMLLDLFNRWWYPRKTDQMLEKLQKDIATGDAKPPRLVPECYYIVQVDDRQVSCTNPEGQVESVEWSDLQKVEIVTTDTGPALPDVFILLHGSNTGCVIPQGATGEQALVESLFRLPGFNYQEMIDAMRSTDNQRFLCWEKPQASHA